MPALHTSFAIKHEGFVAKRTCLAAKPLSYVMKLKGFVIKPKGFATKPFSFAIKRKGFATKPLRFTTKLVSFATHAITQTLCCNADKKRFAARNETAIYSLRHLALCSFHHFHRLFIHGTSR